MGWPNAEIFGPEESSMTGLQDLQTVTGEQIPLIPYSSRTRKNSKEMKNQQVQKKYMTVLLYTARFTFFSGAKATNRLGMGRDALVEISPGL